MSGGGDEDDAADEALFMQESLELQSLQQSYRPISHEKPYTVMKRN